MEVEAELANLLGKDGEQANERVAAAQWEGKSNAPQATMVSSVSITCSSNATTASGSTSNRSSNFDTWKKCGGWYHLDWPAGRVGGELGDQGLVRVLVGFYG